MCTHIVGDVLRTSQQQLLATRKQFAGMLGFHSFIELAASQCKRLLLLPLRYPWGLGDQGQERKLQILDPTSHWVCCIRAWVTPKWRARSPCYFGASRHFGSLKKVHFVCGLSSHLCEEPWLPKCVQRGPLRETPLSFSRGKVDPVLRGLPSQTGETRFSCQEGCQSNKRGPVSNLRELDGEEAYPLVSLDQGPRWCPWCELSSSQKV